MPNDSSKGVNNKIKECWCASIDETNMIMVIRKTGFFYYDVMTKGQLAKSYKGLLANLSVNTLALTSFNNETMLFNATLKIDDKN